MEEKKVHKKIRLDMHNLPLSKAGYDVPEYIPRVNVHIHGDTVEEVMEWFTKDSTMMVMHNSTVNSLGRYYATLRLHIPNIREFINEMLLFLNTARQNRKEAANKLSDELTFSLGKMLEIGEFSAIIQNKVDDGALGGLQKLVKKLEQHKQNKR